MLKELLYLLSSVIIFVGIFRPLDVNAASYPPVGCTIDSDCTGNNPCTGCTGNTAWCDISRHECRFTCTNCGCTCGFGGWSECNGGYMTRECTCDPNIYQISYCGPEPTNPPGTPQPPTPTFPPGTPTPTFSPTPTVPLPGCTITIPASYSLAAGNVISVSPVVTAVATTISNVSFVISPPVPYEATVCASGTGPCGAASSSYTDSAAAFNADLTGISAGTTTLTVTGTTAVGTTCTDSAIVNVADPSAWWQCGGGDIVSGNITGTGTITSLIPATCTLPTCNPVLIRNNSSGYSGVPSAGGSPVNVGTGTYSSANWRVTSGPFLGTEGYSYAYFERKIPSGVTPTLVTGPTLAPTAFESGGAEYPSGSGYFWYQYNGAQGNLTISGGDGSVDLNNRKVIFFVKNANVTLGTKVTVADGRGGFYLFAGQNISVSPTVGDAPVAAPTPDIEGMLFAEGQVLTGTGGAGSDPQLAIRGGLIGLGASGGVMGVNDGIVFQRNMTNDALYPGDYVEYAPDMILNWPTNMTRRTLQWREVAP